MSLNVNPEVEDTYYRYKMPKLMTKIEGKGNGIKTVITNISDIAKAIYRKPSYPIKYFGMELGTQTILGESNDRYIVNGNHDASKLQEVLYTFIKKFVLCSKCGNPETFLTIKKKVGTVVAKCKACGNSDVLDIKHKITQYIFKNPPETEAEGAAVNLKATEENEEIDEAEVIEESTLNEQRSTITDQMLEEAENKLKELSVGDNCKVAPSHARSQQESIDDFFQMVTKKFKEGKLLSERFEIRNAAKQFKLKEGCIMALMEIIFVSPRTILTDIEKYKSLFHLFTRDKGPSKDKFQNYVIAGMMKLAEKFNLASKSCYLLRALYDNDIIEEHIIIDWYEKGPSKKYVAKDLSKEILEACGPMIDWLKTADYESGEDEENETILENEMPVSTNLTGHKFSLIQGDDDDVIDIDDL